MSPSSPSSGAPGGAPAPKPGELRGVDRRRAPTPRFSRYTLFGGRRKTIRREFEREGSFVDVYPRRLVGLVLWIGLMNAADSFFTLVHLQNGGIELNPVAAWLLEAGRMGFVFWKSFLIALALVVLVLHKNFRLARVGLGISASAYTLLVGYHLLLFRI